MRQPQRALLFQFDHVPGAITEPYERVLGSAKPCRTRVRASFDAGRRIYMYSTGALFTGGQKSEDSLNCIDPPRSDSSGGQASTYFYAQGGESSSLNAGRCAGNPPDHEPPSPSFRLVVSGRFRSAESTTFSHGSGSPSPDRFPKRLPEQRQRAVHQHCGVTQDPYWPAAVFREADFPGIGSERSLSTVRL